MSDPTADRPAVFEVEGVKFAYRGTSTRVLEAVDLRIPLGGKVCLVGPNGAGKSTLLYLLGLLCEDPFKGRITCRLPGEEAVEYNCLSSSAKAALRSRRFGFVLQDAYLMPQLTCGENVAMPLLLQGRPKRQALADAHDLLKRAGGDELGHLRDRQVDTLSGGQRQMIAFLRAIIHSPDVVFADEPTQSLDARNATRFLNLLDSWHKEGAANPRTLILVLHDPGSVSEGAEMVVFLGPDHKVRRARPFTMEEIEEEARADGIHGEERIRRWMCQERIKRWIMEGR